MEHSINPSTRIKRKPSSSTTLSKSKRRRQHSPPPSNSLPLASAAPTRSTLKPQRSHCNRVAELKPRKKTEHRTLFSRYADPSVQSPKSKTNKNKQSDQLRTPSFQSHRGQPVESLAVKEVVDLVTVSEIAKLEIVEGDEILTTMLKVSTPRIRRRFLSEEALSNSEQRDREVLRLRRLKLRAQYSSMKEQQKKVDENLENVPVKIDRKLNKCRAKEKGGGEVQIDERAQIEEEEAETDEETTESKINRLSKVMHMDWRQFMQRIVASATILCVVVSTAPFVKKVLEAPLPYCDSDWIEAIDGSFVLADPADEFDRSKALQPFIEANAMTAQTLGPTCQPCPVFGNCLNGSVISCAPPYLLRSGLCMEDPEAQRNLNRVARNIQKFVTETVTKSVCNNLLPWSFYDALTGVESNPDQEHTASISVLLSDVQAFVTGTVSFSKAMSVLPREYVYNRALDLALRDLKDVYVTEDQTQLVVGDSVVPWFCRAKRQLHLHLKLIALAVALGTLLVFAYRKFLFYRAERQLVDRFVKEVRFFLLDRTRRPDRFYPSEQLRDDLFEEQSGQDRAWLNKSVWPKVVAVINDDFRINKRLMRVQNDDLIVWEWAFSSSPARRPNRGEGHRASLRLQHASGDHSTSTQVHQRKKVRGKVEEKKYT